MLSLFVASQNHLKIIWIISDCSEKIFIIERKKLVEGEILDKISVLSLSECIDECKSVCVFVIFQKLFDKLFPEFPESRIFLFFYFIFFFVKKISSFEISKNSCKQLFGSKFSVKFLKKPEIFNFYFLK